MHEEKRQQHGQRERERRRETKRKVITHWLPGHERSFLREAAGVCQGCIACEPRVVDPSQAGPERQRERAKEKRDTFGPQEKKETLARFAAAVYL